MADNKLTKNYEKLLATSEALKSMAEELGVVASSEMTHEELSPRELEHKKSHQNTSFWISSQTIEAKKGPDATASSKRNFAQAVLTLETSAFSNDSLAKLTELRRSISDPNSRYPITVSMLSGGNSSKLVIEISSPQILQDKGAMPELGAGLVAKKFFKIASEVIDQVSLINTEIKAEKQTVTETAYPGANIHRNGVRLPADVEPVDEGKIVSIRTATEEGLEKIRNRYEIVPRENEILPHAQKVEIVSGGKAVERLNPELAEEAKEKLAEEAEISKAEQTEAPSLTAAKAKRLRMSEDDLTRLQQEVEEIKGAGKKHAAKAAASKLKDPQEKAI